MLIKIISAKTLSLFAFGLAMKELTTHPPYPYPHPLLSPPFVLLDHPFNIGSPVTK